jgi:hypothetical protein
MTTTFTLPPYLAQASVDVLIATAKSWRQIAFHATHKSARTWWLRQAIALEAYIATH